MENYLNAKDASKLSQENDPENWIKDLKTILKEIEEAAKKGETTLKTYTGGFGDGKFYSSDPLHKLCNTAQNNILNKLKELGYKTKMRSKESQFVDIWLEISW